ncbi:cupin domain-containing protein [Geopseudomonas aromaticivorans]|uniref:cupin domain-containing protein n=1 Tax=Geopseudomonas aromaticivorans TaxID=2849492 RepID=UPI0020C9260F|nr:cupin domain-containing protein [Pseudomonas aromaticivorans]
MKPSQPPPEAPALQAAILRPDPAAAFFTAERCRILEVLNHAGDPAVSVAEARVAPGVTTQLHRLHGVVERYLIVKGRGMVDVGGLQPSEVGPGDLVVIPAGVPQRIGTLGEEELVFYCICTPRFTPECYETLGE